MDDTTFRAIFASPIGDLLLSERDEALVGVDLIDAASAAGSGGGRPLGGGRTDAFHGPGGATLSAAQRQLGAYFAGRLRVFDLPLRLHGNPFQLAVWAALRDIPYGTTISYSDLARRLGKASAARAVGGAVGRNPLAIVVPCHRVVGARGDLTGFAWGLERKRRLLELETQVSRAS